MSAPDDVPTRHPEAGPPVEEDSATSRDAEVGPASGRQLGPFRLDALIGRGGMGRVYEAWDPRLRRTVAVKVLRGESPVAVRRFVREARTQAGVQHPGICPVYEAGEVDGSPYIVMQRLYGSPLDRAAEGLPLEPKLVLVRQVAEAVHAAHRTGLIHRDLKPANILVEPTAEGPLRPVVVDFGLARFSTADDGFTRAGDIVGTPAYMAPEQILGDNDQIDRRSDVYALGVTLYRLLAGDVPFGGVGGGALVRVLADDPAPMRRFGVPPDVEAIVFKCLEKDPAQRYGSARDLAADLDRFLDGEPVQARPTDFWYRLRKWVDRHRAPVAVAAVSALLLVVALTWGAWTAWQADERERLARDFTERVEEIEALVRYSHLSPLHDVRPDRQLLRQRMAAIREAMDRAGRAGRGPGHHALGRGHLALDELELAHEHASRAWDGGYRHPEVAATLGLALSALYREHLAAIELGGDWQARGQRIAELRRIYGHPARAFLETYDDGERIQPGEASTPEELLLEALVHFHDDRFTAALDRLDTIRGHRPWSYELDRLEGDIHRTSAVEHAAAGDDDDARRALDRAVGAYTRAAQTAESDPAAHRAVAQATFLRFALDPTGDEAADLFTSGMASLDRARRAHPLDPRTELWTARFHRRMAQTLREASDDPTTHLDHAIEAAWRAAQHLDEPSPAWAEQGRAQWSWAQWLGEQGEDPIERLTLATAAFERVAPAFRGYGYWTAVGLARSTLAGHRSRHGKPASDLFTRAADAYREATRLHSNPFAAWTNLGVALYKASELPETASAETTLAEAIEALERAHTLEPDHLAPLYYLGLSRLRLALAGDSVYGRLDPRLATQALDEQQRALAVAPHRFEVHSAIGEIHHLRGVALSEVGDDPSAAFEHAEAAYQRALELAPDHPVPTINLAWTAYFRALDAVRIGRSPEPALRLSIDLATRVRDSGRATAAFNCLGAAHTLDATWRMAEGGDPSTALDRAREALGEALRSNPRLVEGHRLAGRVETLAAEYALRLGQDPEAAFGRAAEHLDRAVGARPDAATPQLGLAALAVVRSRWHVMRGRADDARSTASDGLAAIERARAAYPDHVEIAGLEAALREVARR